MVLKNLGSSLLILAGISALSPLCVGSTLQASESIAKPQAGSTSHSATTRIASQKEIAEDYLRTLRLNRTAYMIDFSFELVDFTAEKPLENQNGVLYVGSQGEKRLDLWFTENPAPWICSSGSYGTWMILGNHPFSIEASRPGSLAGEAWCSQLALQARQTEDWYTVLTLNQIQRIEHCEWTLDDAQRWHLAARNPTTPDLSADVSFQFDPSAKSVSYLELRFANGSTLAMSDFIEVSGLGRRPTRFEWTYSTEEGAERQFRWVVRRMVPLSMLGLQIDFQPPSSTTKRWANLEGIMSCDEDGKLELRRSR